jgi:hypothetical protein
MQVRTKVEHDEQELPPALASAWGIGSESASGTWSDVSTENAHTGLKKIIKRESSY